MRERIDDLLEYLADGDTLPTITLSGIFGLTLAAVVKWMM